ncbi:hypothetical protein F5146DRAFT_497514 [Armillaria mellea]|nr:hypothetical protein F5146DRAFT_497514 [Armillaria mellea]
MFSDCCLCSLVLAFISFTALRLRLCASSLLSILSAAIHQDFSIASGTTGKVLGNQRLFLDLLHFEIKALRQVGEVVSTSILSAFLGSQIVSVVQILSEGSIAQC